MSQKQTTQRRLARGQRGTAAGTPAAASPGWAWRGPRAFLPGGRAGRRKEFVPYREGSGIACRPAGTPATFLMTNFGRVSGGVGFPCVFQLTEES